MKGTRSLQSSMKIQLALLIRKGETPYLSGSLLLIFVRPINQPPRKK